jgi:hypothetical protein
MKIKSEKEQMREMIYHLEGIISWQSHIVKISDNLLSLQ